MSYFKKSHAHLPMKGKGSYRRITGADLSEFDVVELFETDDIVEVLMNGECMGVAAKDTHIGHSIDKVLFVLAAIYNLPVRFSCPTFSKTFSQHPEELVLLKSHPDMIVDIVVEEDNWASVSFDGDIQFACFSVQSLYEPVLLAKEIVRKFLTSEYMTIDWEGVIWKTK